MLRKSGFHPLSSAVMAPAAAARQRRLDAAIVDLDVAHAAFDRALKGFDPEHRSKAEIVSGIIASGHIGPLGLGLGNTFGKGRMS